MHWYTVNTKPHQEHLAEINVRRLGVESSYPKMSQSKIIRRRRQTVVGPLFPGYFFARFELGDHYRAVSYATGVRSIVTFGSTPAVVSDEIIRGLQARLQEGCLIVPKPSFKSGDVIRIRQGPLEGLEAVFEREVSDRQRVVLLLRALAYQARVVVPIEQVANI